MPRNANELFAEIRTQLTRERDAWAKLPAPEKADTDPLDRILDSAEAEVAGAMKSPMQRDNLGYPAGWFDKPDVNPGGAAPPAGMMPGNLPEGAATSPGLTLGKLPGFASDGTPATNPADLPLEFQPPASAPKEGAKDQTAEGAYAVLKDTEAKAAAPDDDLPVSDAQKAALAAAGYDTPEKVAAASDDELKAVPGVGAATVAKLRQTAN